MTDSTLRALRVRALNAVDHTRSLAASDPVWGSDVHPFAGGWLVLAGAGMYVNQAMAAGIDVGIVADDVDLLVARSKAVGTTPACEVTPSTLPASLGELAQRGFVHATDADVTLLTRAVEETPTSSAADVDVRLVESDADLRRWQQTSAAGWGHTSPEARRTADAFAAAAKALDNEHMVIAFDPVDDRPVGCASMTVRDGVAMLGGMSTVPTERRRGVQAALLRYRLIRADQLGCDLAITTAATGGASERNLQRHGFTVRAIIQKYCLPDGPA